VKHGWDGGDEMGKHKENKRVVGGGLHTAMHAPSKR
jgi:hypothetical protein